MTVLHKNKIIKVGDIVTIFGTNQHGKVIKVTENYIKIDGVGVKHISVVEPHGLPRFFETKTIETVKELIELVQSIPEEFSEGPLLKIDYPEEVSGVFARFDESHIISGEPCNRDLVEPDEYTRDDRGISGLKSWVNELESDSKVLDSLLIITDEDGFKNHLVMNISLNSYNAAISIKLKYISQPAHFEDNLSDIESIIQNWFSKYPMLQDSMLRGIKYRKSVLIGEHVMPNSKSSMELDVADNLLKDCLLMWPNQPYGKNKNIAFRELLTEYRGDDDFMDRIYILIRLIENKGINQNC